MNQKEAFHATSVLASALLGKTDMPYVLIAQEDDGRLTIASNMESDGVTLMCKEVFDNGANLTEEKTA